MLTDVKEALTEPFTIFCVFSVLAPILPTTNPDVTISDVIAHLTHPAVLLCALLFHATVLSATIGGRPARKLTRCERCVARWWLLNGVVIHVLLDGLVGFHKVNPYFAAMFAKVDKRFAEPLGSVAGSAVHLLTACELYLYTPLCLALYWCYQRSHPMRDGLEIVCCAVQIYGTVVYNGQEILTGFKNYVPAGGAAFSLDTLTLDHVVYFWFGVVFCNLLWIFVPLLLLVRALRRASTAAAASQGLETGKKHK